MNAALDALKDAGFHWATRAGVTIAIEDVVAPPRKAEIMEEYERRGFVIDRSMRDELDVWEYMFFGEQALLHMSFRKSANESDGVPLPIRQTTRGWVTDDSWSVDPPGDLYYPSMSMGCSPISIARSTPLTIAQRE